MIIPWNGQNILFIVTENMLHTTVIEISRSYRAVSNSKTNGSQFLLFFFFLIVGLRVPAWHIKELSLLNTCSSSKPYHCARCASAATVLCRDIDIFRTKTVVITHI
jgi:hypothetical protein